MDFVECLAQKYGIALNSQQQQAVININGPTLLLAVPGGGKTTVIVSRCANMILNHGIDPKNILTLTFSRASAADMKQRFTEIFSEYIDGSPLFSTIHSFCYKVLSTYCKNNQIAFPLVIENENASISKSKLLRKIILETNKEYLTDDKLEELINGICYVKNKMIDEKDVVKLKFPIANFPKIYKVYKKYMSENNLIDFDDMLVKTYEVLRKDRKLLKTFKNRYTYINVDESQDTSLLQHKIIETLAKPENNIFMVGDEDQSIYAFRAAHPRALLDFGKTFPGARILLMETNYRSTGKIVCAAAEFIKQNKERYDKNMTFVKDEGVPIKKTILEERDDQYKYILSFLKNERSFRETAILFRNNISAVPIADMLDRAGIPFYIRESVQGIFSHWITADLLSFINLSFNPADIHALQQIYFKLNAYISKDMMIYANENSRLNTNLFDILTGYPDMPERQKYKLMDIKNNIEKISKMNPPQALEHISDTMEYKKYLNGHNNNFSGSGDSLTEVVSILKSISKSTTNLQDFENRLTSLRSSMENSKYNKHKNAVTVSTIHSSKGLEFDKVFIIDLFDGEFPSSYSIKEADIGNISLIEEEVRLFYVGSTRAKYHLELLSSLKSDGKKIRPSRFIERFTALSVKKELKGTIVLPHKIIPGQTLIHKKFGAGTVQFINNKADMVEILFTDNGLRKLSIEICTKNGLLLDSDESFNA